MMNWRPTTSPPSCSTSSASALAVPPVARTSSWISTRAPSPNASARSSSVFLPYSSAYSALIVSSGSLPGLRAGTKPQPSLYAIAEPTKKPRASAPATMAGVPPPGPVAEDVDRLPERVGVREQRHDVLEDDARLRPVRDVADQRLQPLDVGDGQRAEASCRRARHEGSWG